MYLSKLENVFVCWLSWLPIMKKESSWIWLFQELVGRERARSTFVSQLQLLSPQTHRQCAPGKRAEVPLWKIFILNSFKNSLQRSRTHKDDLAPDTFVKVSLSRATKVIKVRLLSHRVITEPPRLSRLKSFPLKTDLRWRRAASWGAAPARSTASPSTSSCRRRCSTPPPSTSPSLRWTSFFVEQLPF